MNRCMELCPKCLELMKNGFDVDALSGAKKCECANCKKVGYGTMCLVKSYEEDDL